MGARKDMAMSFSRMTQEEVDLFCMEWGIGTTFKPVAPACDKFVNECPPGSIALYCRHFEFSNLRHPFSNFVLNILEYYRVSFGQIHPLGMARVLHFEILCRSSGYDPSLLSFRRFFRLAKNGDWFTFETTQVDTCLISSMVSTLGVWKDRFFWVSEEIVHFKLVWRHADAVLNEPEPSASDINTRFLETLRECSSRLRPFPEHLLVLLGLSKLWEKRDRDPVLMRDGKVMFALDFIKSDDTSDVAFDDAATTPGEDAVVRGSDYRFEGSGYVNVPNVKGFTKTTASKVSTRRSQRYLKGVDQPSGSEAVDISDDIEVSAEQTIDVGKGKEKELIVSSKKKKLVKKGTPPVIQGSSVKNVEGFEGSEGQEVYVPNWGVKVGDSFKDPAVCAEALAHFAPAGPCWLKVLPGLPKVCRNTRKPQRRRKKMKASIAAMRKEIDGFSEKELTWVKKVGDLTKRHETEMGALKKSFEADRLKLKSDREALVVQQKAFDEEKDGLKTLVALATGDNQWLIEQGFHQVVTYLLHSKEFNSALGKVYTKLLNLGKHQGLITGYKLHESGHPLEKSPLYRPEASDIFKSSVEQTERLTYPYVSQVASCYGKPLSVL
ncbi:hypothetical protein HanPI659440_Chr10g0399911 [Helianthus annuus]|nr:hypothetical protein HanPI659440_Chr10g0399911 [Helianthus annuus]